MSKMIKELVTGLEELAKEGRPEWEDFFQALNRSADLDEIRIWFQDWLNGDLN